MTAPAPAEQFDRAAVQSEVHTSIVNSDWWQNLSPVRQELYGIELSRIDDAITWSELEIRFASAKASTAMRAAACPGYPANPAGDVILNTQADVNAFGALKCKEIVGELLIEDLGTDPICDLTPLKGLKKIGSSLTIDAGCLTSLAGLEKLKSVGELGPFGFVGILGANLVDIEALAKLSTVTGSINIIACDQLTSVTCAFSQVTTIESGKTAVPLTSIFVLNISDNPVLTDLSAFSNLTHIEGGLRILFNGAIADLDDFSGLNTIGDRIWLIENTSLQHVNELSNITALAGDLLVYDNPALTQCCGLYNLVCSNPPGCTSPGAAGIVFIDNNGAGCTVTDIITNGACP
ncbi:MAG: hypothetical protein R3301_12150 [Saprospiraceae bacterium]|nr:hypothetical protein [Saprospiraceae bacterium]